MITTDASEKHTTCEVPRKLHSRSDVTALRFTFKSHKHARSGRSSFLFYTHDIFTMRCPLFPPFVHIFSSDGFVFLLCLVRPNFHFHQLLHEKDEDLIQLVWGFHYCTFARLGFLLKSSCIMDFISSSTQVTFVFIAQVMRHEMAFSDYAPGPGLLLQEKSSTSYTPWNASGKQILGARITKRMKFWIWKMVRNRMQMS